MKICPHLLWYVYVFDHLSIISIECHHLSLYVNIFVMFHQMSAYFKFKHISVVCQPISFFSTNVNVFQVSVPMELPPLPDSGTILLIRPSDALPPVKAARLPVSLCNHPVRCSHHAQVHGPRPVRISHPQCGDLPWPLSPGPLPLNDGLLPLADLLASGAG